MVVAMAGRLLWAAVEMSRATHTLQNQAQVGVEVEVVEVVGEMSAHSQSECGTQVARRWR